MIFGRPGSGKTIFAFELSQKLKLPLDHIDKYFYTSNWVERDYEEFLNIQKELVSKDHWIIDGNATRSLEMRYKRANIVIYFCYPRFKSLFNIIKRKFFYKKNININDRADGCHETIRWSLIKYIWTFENRVKDKIKELNLQYPEVKFYKITNDREREEIKNKILAQAKLPFR
jgi:adenylate kinase family enzyme